MNSFTFPLPLINQDQRRRRRRRTYSFFFERRTIRLQRFFVPQSDNLSFLDPETSPVPRLSLDPSADVKIRLRRYSESRASSIQSRDVSPWPTGARRESERVLSRKRKKPARRIELVVLSRLKQMVAGAAYVPFGVRRIIPTVFLRSTPLRSLMIFRVPLVASLPRESFKYLLGKGLDEGREGRVGFEDETIVWKSVSRRSPIIAAGRIY